VADAVRIEGLNELRRALRDMERTAPRELNKAVKEAMQPVELVASARTPRGDTGNLQASNRITTKGARVVLQNTAPYANTIHWGRKVAKNTGRPVVSIVKGRPWMYDTLMEQRDEVGRRVIRSIEIFIERQVPRS
jgi:hypothetical protein